MTTSVFALWISMLAIAQSLPAGVYVGKNGEVGASWGGYSASAGLGGLVSGNGGTKGGLHAEAGTPDGHFAAAGLGGSVSGGGTQGGLYSVAGQGQGTAVGVSHASSHASSSASASSGTGNVQLVNNKRPPGTFFDDIFNIPISVLGAVNQYLNNNHKTKVVAVQGSTSSSSASAGGHVHVAKPVQTTQTHASSSASATASAGANAGVGSGTVASGGVDNNIYHGQHKRPASYDDIFNIPISVLGAVNRLLNNGK